MGGRLGRKQARKPPITVDNIDDKHVCVTWDGVEYVIEKLYTWPDGVPTPYWHEETGKWCCTRSRDFGGCGKDAVKPEKNVPFTRWLYEVHAKEVENGTEKGKEASQEVPAVQPDHS